ncbi:MAG TPA: surface-adhesin E family protein [Nitrospiraceae bacterium]
MKRLLLTILLFLSSNPAYANWVAVGGKVEAGMDANADPVTMNREGDLVKMEILLDFKTRQTKAGVSYSSANAQMEYDCAEQRFRGLAVMYFSGNIGSGNLLDRSSGKGKRLPVSPGSLDQTLWKVACSKK